MNAMTIERLISVFSENLTPNMGLTVAHLLAMAKVSDADVSAEAWHGLCRKIHVTKNLKLAYDGNGWGRPTTDQAVPPGALGLATVLLLHRAANSPRALQLKWLGAALAGWDLYCQVAEATPDGGIGSEVTTEISTELDRLVDTVGRP